MKTKSDKKRILHHWREAVPNDRMAHLIRDAARLLGRELKNSLIQHAIPFGHWTFLRILWQRDGLTQKELSDLAGVMEPTTFVAIKAMELQGYIKRQKSPNNRKNMYVFLTSRGKLLEKKLVPLAVEVNELAFKGVSQEHLKITRQTLLRSIENLESNNDDLTQTN